MFLVLLPRKSHGLQPTRPLRPWDFPGKSTGVGCHCLLRIEGLHRAKSKFSGCGKIHISKSWRFTECSEDEFGSMVAEEQFILGGYRIKYISNCSSWKNVRSCTHESCGVAPAVLMSTNKSYSAVK